MAQKSSLPVAVGLDLGSAYVRCVVGLSESESGAPSVVGVGEARSGGVRKGVVVDIEETVSAITAAIDEAERISGIAINRTSVGINGNHLLTVGSHGIIAIGSDNREIGEADVARVEQAAAVMQLPPNREIIQVFPRNYMLDGQEHIKDPVGMSGMRLEVDSSLITAGTPFIKNLTRSVHQAGFNISHYIAGPLAAAETLLDKKTKDLGCVLIDVGATTTGMAVFEEGELLHVGVIPVGSAHISNDLAVGLRTDVETAEKVKLEYVDGAPSNKTKHNRNLRIKEINGQDLVVTQREIDSIVHDRLDDLFGLVDAELKKLKKEGMLAGGVVLCGGGAKLKNLNDYVKDSLRLPSRIAKPEGFAGIVDKISDPAYATVIGLMLEDLNSPQTNHALSSVVDGGKGLLKSLIKRLRK